ncbi:MAG: DUF1343 domain-containing protein [Ignavibacteria bacterium]|nr:DUF1343 domain-containing protein [Ignavibacteria bacterium]MBT8387804.1 DUF1343 domain-containing protein [Ignavibacteria bacterium]
MKLSITIILFLISTSVLSCNQSLHEEQFLLGSDVLVKENLHLLDGERVGIVCNKNSVLVNGVHLIDTLLSLGITIAAIYALEHGFSLQFADGVLIKNPNEKIKSIPVHSLYGKVKKPTEEMLTNIDIVLFDVQDVGARFYTYISSMFYILQAAAENKIKVVILDRPNPIGGVVVDGPILIDKYKSFFGIAPIPILHGMTIGELAKLFTSENYMASARPDVEIIKMKGWERYSYWDDLNITWLPTSPNIPTFETALVYPGTCLIEGTNISEGRGTENPFLTIGAPFINPDKLISELQTEISNGIEYSPIEFIPKEILGKAVKPKFEGEKCYGIIIKVTDKEKFSAIDFGLNLVYTLHKLYPDQFEFRENHFDLLTGNNKIRLSFEKGDSPDLIKKSWQKNLENFKEIRNKYLLY